MLNLFGSLIASNVPPRREGQGLAEYGMILIVASIPVVVVLFALAPRIDAFFAAVRSGLPWRLVTSATPAPPSAG